MKRIIIVLAVAIISAACDKSFENINYYEPCDEALIITGYNGEYTRTEFGTPNDTEIPFLWSAGDYIWLGENRSQSISEDCSLAHFNFDAGTAVIGTGHVFYNMTGKAKSANVPTEQSAHKNLGENGDFGYATLDEYNSFYLKHKTAYIWFDTTTQDVDLPKLSSITLSTEDIDIAGQRVYDFDNDSWEDTTTEASNSITLSFGDGIKLQESNEGVMATMVVLPASISGSEITITYTFANGLIYKEVKHPTKNLVAGATQRIATTIAINDLEQATAEVAITADKSSIVADGEEKVTFTVTVDGVATTEGVKIINVADNSELPNFEFTTTTAGEYQFKAIYGEVESEIVTITANEPELSYELRVLTFEDEDTKFQPYTLDYAGADITTWSDLIDDPQYGGPLTYGDYSNTAYTWWDEGNTELCHTFPYNYAYCFWGGGHAISNYWGEGWSDEDRDNHIAKYYGEDYVIENAGNDQMLGWFNLQFMIPVEAHSGDNFVVHYGYKDDYAYIENLPEIAFADDVARVIDHMWVTNTNYTLNQLYNGVKSEAGNSFGGNWEGLTEDAWLKIVAQGFDDVEAYAYAEPISEVEFYLVQGENVVTDWQKWDLSVLGAVKKVRFNFLYSEEMGGRYGFTIPGYFAYDDVAVRFEK